MIFDPDDMAPGQKKVYDEMLELGSKYPELRPLFSDSGHIYPAEEEDAKKLIIQTLVNEEGYKKKEQKKRADNLIYMRRLINVRIPDDRWPHNNQKMRTDDDGNLWLDTISESIKLKKIFNRIIRECR